MARDSTHLPDLGADEINTPVRAAMVCVGKDHVSILKVGEPYVDLIAVAVNVSLAFEALTNALQVLVQ